MNQCPQWTQLQRSNVAEEDVFMVLTCRNACVAELHIGHCRQSLNASPVKPSLSSCVSMQIIPWSSSSSPVVELSTGIPAYIESSLKSITLRDTSDPPLRAEPFPSALGLLRTRRGPIVPSRSRKCTPCVEAPVDRGSCSLKMHGNYKIHWYDI